MALPKPPGCAGCPAEHIGRGYVPARGPLDAEVICIGQGPGRREHETGLPFVGPTGHKLRTWLARAGYNPDAVYYDNVVRCWLPGDRDGKPAEIAHCRAAHWGPALATCTSARLVCVGLSAARTLIDPNANEAALGLIQEIDV